MNYYELLLVAIVMNNSISCYGSLILAIIIKFKLFSKTNIKDKNIKTNRN